MDGNGATRGPGAPARTAGDLREVLARLMDRARPAAASHGPVYRQLWDELGRAVDGGKRFRGRLVGAVHDALGGQRPEAAAQVGAAFELLHVGFLVHDDLIDHDTMRRGEPNLAARMATSARAAGASERAAQELAEGAAVLAGDLAIALAHRLVATVEVPAPVHSRLQELLWETVFVSVAGEMGDVAAALGLQEPSLDDALRIAAEKTALYSFQAPLRAGAILADAPVELRGQIEAVGLALGKAFQLVDDLLGVFGPESVTGKSSLSDLREGKATTLVLHARTLPVWASIGADVGRFDLDEATAVVLRRELARSAAPELVTRQARAELDAATRLLDGCVELVSVLAPVSAMVERSLTDAERYVAEAATSGPFTS